MNKKPLILLVEDDANLGFVVKDNLEYRGFEVCLCEDGLSGYEAFCEHHFDLCLLDVMMPKEDGFSLASKIRSRNKQVPILFLTARQMKEDKIAGFSLGADDYITKPFSMEELVLRMKVFLKRSGKSSDPVPDHIAIGAYTFDHANLNLVHPDTEKKLTRREADLLRLLCDHAGNTVKREDILKTVWGNDDYFAGRSMDVFISRLRKYLSFDPSIEIVNYHGVGFRLLVKAL